MDFMPPLCSNHNLIEIFNHETDTYYVSTTCRLSVIVLEILINHFERVVAEGTSLRTSDSRLKYLTF